MVGTFSNHGIEPDFDNNAIVKANQDRGSVDFPFNGNPEAALFCCLDGHGREGDKVSQFVVEQLNQLLERDQARLDRDPVVAFKEAFELADRKLLNSDINSQSSGTSCVAAYLNKDKVLPPGWPPSNFHSFTPLVAVAYRGSFGMRTAGIRGRSWGGRRVPTSCTTISRGTRSRTPTARGRGSSRLEVPLPPETPSALTQSHSAHPS